MNLTVAGLLLLVAFEFSGCADDYLPVETSTPPTAEDLELGGMQFDASGRITHLRDDETGDWLPLTQEESELLTARYRQTVDHVGRPKGYNPPNDSEGGHGSQVGQ